MILMEDMVLLARNTVVAKLAALMQVPIRLSDDQAPESTPPYGYYSIVTPYAATGELGSHIQQTKTDTGTGEKFVQDIRYEHPELVLSFSFCSSNRVLEDGTCVNGEAESMLLAMKAVAWLKHEGASELSAQNFVVSRVSGCASRSGFSSDVFVRRWGFDVSIRYKAMTIRRDNILENVLVTQQEKE